MFARLLALIRQVIGRMFPYRTVEQVENIETPISAEMKQALDTWYAMYTDNAPWADNKVKTLNLAALISSEIARQVINEFKWNITGGEAQADNARVLFLRQETARIMEMLLRKLEQGLASGGMILKPYIRDGHIFYDWGMAWDIYPIAFDDEENLSDVIFTDRYLDGKKIYTRLERHKRNGDTITITNRCYESNDEKNIGTEVPLDTVDIWKDIEPETTIANTGGMMFGYFKAATANNVDVSGAFGVSVFSKAVSTIRQADLQYSRMLWEYEGTELAVHVDENSLKGNPGDRKWAELSDRLYRKVDFGKNDTYEVYSPQIRDSAYLAGLNMLLQKIEDQCGISRGTLSDANTQARTATELKILKERTYTTIHSNQMALERCLRDALRAANVYASLYNLAPEGEYDTSFEWDDSIITDTTQQLAERMELFSNKMISRVEMRMWYFGETEAQAAEAIAKIDEENGGDMLEEGTEALALGGMMPEMLTGMSGLTQGATNDVGQGNTSPEEEAP